MSTKCPQIPSRAHIKKRLSARLLLFREARGLTQEALGALLIPPRPQRDIHTWEQGITRIPAEEVPGLAQVLHVSVNAFYAEILTQPLTKDRPYMDALCTIHDPIRKADWERWLGTDTVPVRSHTPQKALLPDHDTEVEVYVLDHEKLTSEQRAHLVAGIAERFQVPYEEVLAELLRRGIAIPATNCTAMLLPSSDSETGA